MPRSGQLALTALVLSGLAIAVLPRRFDDATGTAVPRLGAPVTVTVSSRPMGGPVPPGFLGMSFEYPAVLSYAGADPATPNPVLVQLIRNLDPGGSPVIRIGGDSTDSTWWPIPRWRPPWVMYTLSPRWLAVVRALASRAGARLILGINLEADSPRVAAAEANALASGFGSRLLALEPGNEPTRYALFPWYRNRRHRAVWARKRNYAFHTFNTEFVRTARSIPRRVTLAGPTLGGPAWMDHLGRFLTTEPRVGLVTYHSYPLNRCFTPPSAPTSATVAHLLSRSASGGLAAGVAGYVKTARHRHLPLRVDEINSVACGGRSGVSDTFASALWVLDTSFAMVRAGVQGLNVHSFPGAAYAPFRLRRVSGRWRVIVSPEYYGLLAFAHAAPAGSRLLRLKLTPSNAVRAWATQGADGNLRLVLINTDTVRSHPAQIVSPGATTRARVEWLTAPSVHATTGVALAGTQIGSTTGLLTAPRLDALHGSMPGRFRLVVPPGSAAIVTTTLG